MGEDRCVQGTVRHTSHSSCKYAALTPFNLTYVTDAILSGLNAKGAGRFNAVAFILRGPCGPNLKGAGKLHMAMEEGRVLGLGV